MEWNEQAVEQLIERHIAGRWHRIQRLLQMGYEREDIEQELRIALWRAAQRWSPKKRAPLMKWLAYRIDYTLRNLESRAADIRRNTRMVI